MTAVRPPHLTSAQAARADAVIAVLNRLWPKCFYVFERQRPPLMIGIDKVLLDQMAPAIQAGRISEYDIKLALRCYTGADGYLEHIAIINNVRIALDGSPIGFVTEHQARRARWQITKRRKQKLERTNAPDERNALMDVGTEGVGRAEGGLSATGMEISAVR